MGSCFEPLSPGHYLGLVVHLGYQCDGSIEWDTRIAQLNMKNVRGIASEELKFEGRSVLKILGESKRIKRVRALPVKNSTRRVEGLRGGS